MSCNILVCNKAGSSGEISGISSAKVIYTHNETLAVWRSRFPTRNIGEYHRNFSLIKITDKTKEDIEYLTDAIIVDGEPINKWYFASPDSSTDEWEVLFLTGEIKKTFAEVLTFIRERN